MLFSQELFYVVDLFGVEYQFDFIWAKECAAVSSNHWKCYYLQSLYHVVHFLGPLLGTGSGYFSLAILILHLHLLH